MKITSIKKNKILPYIVIILFSVFLITKVERAFSGSTQEGGVWNLIQLFFVLASLPFLLKNTSNPLPIKIIGFYSLFTGFFSIFTLSDFSIPTLFSFLSIVYPFSVLILFYNIGKNISIEKDLKILQIVYIILFFIIFFAMRNWRLLGDSKGAIADVYYLLGLFPLILATTYKKLRVIPFLLVFVAVLMTGKRAGLIAVLLSTLVYYYTSIGNTKVISKNITVLIVISISMVIIYYLSVYLDSIFGLDFLNRLYKLSEDGGSGRDQIWYYTIDNYFKGNIYEIFFGRGFKAVNEINISHVHNDFLEVLYNYGLFSFLLYLMFYVSIFNICRKMLKTKYNYSFVMAMTLVISLMLSLFSFYIVDVTYITCGFAIYGILLADWEKQKCYDKYSER